MKTETFKKNKFPSFEWNGLGVTTRLIAFLLPYMI
jgi:hypothetical protein